MQIAIGSDHGGYLLKEEIKKWLSENGYEYEDFGTHSTDSCDYPDTAEAVAQEVAATPGRLGIIVCGTGIGVNIVANKVKGVRAALCHDTFSARASREHNNANILTLGERVIGRGLALEVVKVWLKAEFAGGRHQTRVEKIRALEERRS